MTRSMRDVAGVGLVVGAHGHVCRVLADPRFEVPRAEAGDHGMSWLRARVSRFSTGAAHLRRRAVAEAEIASFEPAALRAAAAARTERALAAVGKRFDCMPIARRVPVAVLGAAMQVADADLDELVDCVIAIASVYPPADYGGRDAYADAAVERLAELLATRSNADATSEATANRIGVLVQACDATAGLIGNALRAAVDVPGARALTVDALLTETLRYDPPVLTTRRRATTAAEVGGTNVAQGTTVVLQLAAANRDPSAFRDPDLFAPDRTDADAHLTFGFGPRACPGSSAALAFAAGVVETVLGRCTIPAQVYSYEPSPNLHVLTALEVEIV